MLAHFSVLSNALTSDLCLDPESCYAWSRNVAQHMEHVLDRAEQQFTEFLEYSPHRIICLDERVVEGVDRLGLSWRSFAESIRGGYILEWYDRADLVPFLQAQLKERNTSPARYQVTLHSGGRQARNFRSKSMQDIDARSEYRATPGQYRMILRCLMPTAERTAPLVVAATYDLPKVKGETWALHIGAVSRPAAEKWNQDYTQRLCRCGERTTSYDHLFLPASRYA